METGAVDAHGAGARLQGSVPSLRKIIAANVKPSPPNSAVILL